MEGPTCLGEWKHCIVDPPEGPPFGRRASTTGFKELMHVAIADTPKQEDVSVVHPAKISASGVSLYAVADGHNGKAAARHVGLTLSGELERQLGGAEASEAAVRQALARAFVVVDDTIRRKYFHSGCTLTTACVHGDTLTVANVGDSKAILDTGAEVIELTVDHRIGQSPSEQARLEQAGGRLARLNEYGTGPSTGTSDGVGPVRLWPGGIMVGRAIGDRDVGEILLPHPHIRQFKLPPTGARLIIASDGLWDAMPPGRVVRVLRSHATPKAAAMQAVSSVAACRGGFFSDDVTVVVVDLLPPGCDSFKEVLQQFKGRMRSVLSSPELSQLALPPLAEVVPPQPPPPPPQQQSAAKRRSGLFACFSKPAVLSEESPPSVGHSRSGRSGRHYNPSINPSASLRGGSERSVRGGVARDPSVRGCRLATSVEVIADEDTAHWSSAEWGRRPSVSSIRSGSSRTSSSSAGRSSPRAVVDAHPSVCSLGSSEDDTPGASQSLPRAVSLAILSKKKDHWAPPPLSRRQLSLPVLPGEKKHHGSNAAALQLMLLQMEAA